MGYYTFFIVKNIYFVSNTFGYFYKKICFIYITVKNNF